jgi:hypothetical protein
MADPFTAMAVVGTGLTAFGQIQQGRAAKKAGAYNAAVARNEAIFQERRAAAEAKQSAREAKKLRGTQRARLAAAGQEGPTALNLLAESAEQAELDRQIILMGGDVRAGSARSRAGLAEFEGDAAYRAGLVGAGGTILTSASKFKKKKSLSGVDDPDTGAFFRGNL